MPAVYRADLYTVFGPKADIVVQVLGPRLCVYVDACMLACECYTELTCISFLA